MAAKPDRRSTIQELVRVSSIRVRYCFIIALYLYRRGYSSIICSIRTPVGEPICFIANYLVRQREAVYRFVSLISPHRNRRRGSNRKDVLLTDFFGAVVHVVTDAHDIAPLALLPNATSIDFAAAPSAASARARALLAKRPDVDASLWTRHRDRDRSMPPVVSLELLASSLGVVLFFGVASLFG